MAEYRAIGPSPYAPPVRNYYDAATTYFYRYAPPEPPKPKAVGWLTRTARRRRVGA